jgi:hypothetical protein
MEVSFRLFVVEAVIDCRLSFDTSSSHAHALLVIEKISRRSLCAQEEKKAALAADPTSSQKARTKVIDDETMIDLIDWLVDRLIDVDDLCAMHRIGNRNMRTGVAGNGEG